MEIFLPLMMIIEDGDDFDEDDADVDALVITRLSSFISVLLQLHGRQLHGHFNSVMMVAVMMVMYLVNNEGDIKSCLGDGDHHHHHHHRGYKKAPG